MECRKKKSNLKEWNEGEKREITMKNWREEKKRHNDLL